MEHVLKTLSKLLERPFWIILLVLGALVLVPSAISVEFDPFKLHAAAKVGPPFFTGCALVVLSVLLFLSTRLIDSMVGGLNTARVIKTSAGFETRIENCTVRVSMGLIEDNRFYAPDVAVALPVNEYFDMACLTDPQSSTGAFIKATVNDVPEFYAAMTTHLGNDQRLSPVSIERTAQQKGTSYGIGAAVYLPRQGSQARNVVLTAVTTQRRGAGFQGTPSNTFRAITSIANIAADEQIRRLVMPLFGTGKGTVPPAVALVGMLLAWWEVLRDPVGRTLQEVTLVVYQASGKSSPQVHPRVIRRALALAHLESAPGEKAAAGSS